MRRSDCNALDWTMHIVTCGTAGSSDKTTWRSLTARAVAPRGEAAAGPPSRQNVAGRGGLPRPRALQYRGETGRQGSPSSPSSTNTAPVRPRADDNGAGWPYVVEPEQESPGHEPRRGLHCCPGAVLPDTNPRGDNDDDEARRGSAIDSRPVRRRHGRGT